MQVRKFARLVSTVAFCLAAGVPYGPISLASTPDVSAEEVSLRSSRTDKVDSWHALSRMELIAPNGSPRIREGSVDNALRDNRVDAFRLFRFDRPADIEGTSLLIHENAVADDDLWLFLPSAGKSRRIVASNIKNSFVGTEFAFVDLMTQQVHKFNHTLVGKQDINGVECFIVESFPATSEYAETIGYTKQRAWTRGDNFVTVKIEYYDLKGDLLKTQYLQDLKQVDGEVDKWLPLRREMVNIQTGRKTVILFNDLVVNNGVQTDVFSPSRLGR